jgi:uncharacterized protein with FMN-binding domain
MPGPAVRRFRRFAVPAFWLLAFASWGIVGYRAAQRPQPDLFPFLKRAWPGARYDALGDGRFEVRRDGVVVGYATTGTDYGYGGSMTLAVGATPDGRVHSLAVLEYRDTPDLLKRAQALLGSLVGKPASDPFRVGEDVDAVSGATFSSRGLTNAARAGARRIAERATTSGSPNAHIELGAPEAALLVLALLAATGRNRPSLPPRVRGALKWSVRLGSLALLGVAFDLAWVIAFPVRLLTGDWPPWQVHLYWYTLLAVVLLSFSRAGKSPYCPWLCPFGAAQDVVGLVGGARRRRPHHAALFAWIKRLLLAGAVLVALALGSPGAGSYEVFGTLFRWTGSPWQFAALFFTALVAVFVRRPYCHWVCPVDTVEQALRPLRRRLVGPASARGRRLLPLPLAADTASGPRVDALERFRWRLVTAIGLFVALLTVGHLGERVAVQTVRAQENLMGQTFVTLAE